MSRLEQRRRQRHKRRHRTIGRLILVIIIIAIVFGIYQLFSNTSKFSVTPDISINSTNAILLDLDKGKTLFSKDSSARVYPASLTKVMTAIVAIENIDDLNQTIVLNEKMFPEIYASDATVAGFLPNEEVPAIDLLYGLILPSGAECSIGLAELIAGSDSAFAELMNEKAQKLGMNDTNFENSVGLHDENHYSTVEDLSVMLEYALENETLYEIITSRRHSTRSTNLHPDGITFYSTMFSELQSDELDDGLILGGKTGYTNEAGQCLASLAKKHDNSFILVTCGAFGDKNTQSLHIDDAFTIYNAIQLK